MRFSKLLTAFRALYCVGGIFTVDLFRVGAYLPALGCLVITIATMALAGMARDRINGY